MSSRSTVALPLFAVALSLVSIGPPAAWAQSFDMTGVWRDETANDDDFTTPEKEVLPAKSDESSNNQSDEFSNNFHGTYKSRPYLLITMQNKDNPQGPFFLYSDVGDLRAELRQSAGTPGDYDIIDRRNTHKKLGVLRVNAPDCGDRPACFVFVPPASDLGVPAVRDNLPVLYVPVGKYDPSLNPDLDQTYGNMFSPISANFSYILKCWDLAKMDPVNYQVPGCDQNIFSVPSADKDKYGYRKVAFANWHNAALPFAWTYVSTLFEHGEEHGHTWENGQDVAEADKLKIGMKVSVNIFEVQASAHVSVGVQRKVENMYNSRLTYSKAEYLSTQFALVLNKFYATLDPAFVQRIDDIRSLLKERRGEEVEEEYDRFVADFGTHYANAITFGAKGERVLRMNQKQVLSMHDSQVDVSAGISAGYMGNSVSVDVDKANSNMEKITNNTSEEDRQWYCYSGGTCNDGIPSGDAVLPVQLDLRPISDLIAPPFFDDDQTITTIRDGLSRAIAKHAFTKRDNLNAPASVFVTITGFNRFNITSIGKDVPSTQVDKQECGATNPCRPGAVTLTSQDGSTVKVLSGSVQQPVTWRIPAKLDPSRYPSSPAPGLVSADFTWSGQCLNTASTWEAPDSVSAQVKIPDLTVAPSNAGGMFFVTSPNCVTGDNPLGLVTFITDSAITEVVSAGSLLESGGSGDEADNH